MPAEGERSVGAEIAARFPQAAWLAGRQLHQSKRALEHAWRRVEDAEERAQALQVGAGGRSWVLVGAGGCRAPEGAGPVPARRAGPPPQAAFC